MNRWFICIRHARDFITHVRHGLHLQKTWCLLFKRQIVSLTSCVSNYSFLFLVRRWILHYRTGRQSHPSGVSQHEPLHGRHHGRDEISQDSLARTRRGRAFERRRPFSGGCHRSGSHGPMGLALQGHADSGEKTTKCNGISAFFFSLPPVVGLLARQARGFIGWDRSQASVVETSWETFVVLDLFHPHY